MGIETSEVARTQANQRRAYRIGALAASLLCVGYIVIFPIYANVGVPPNGGKSWFLYLSGKTASWWAILWISVLTDLLFIPVAFSLDTALKETGRYLARVASSLILLFVFLDLAITWSQYGAILILFERYSATSDSSQQVAYLAAADYASAVLASPLEIIYAIVILSAGIFLISILMWNSTFTKLTSSLGLITGALGFLSLTRFGPAIIGNALFATIWLAFVSHGLFKLAKSANTAS